MKKHSYVKSFKINVTYLEKENILNFEIFFNNRLIINENVYFIDIPMLKEGIINDVCIESKKPILVTGCLWTFWLLSRSILEINPRR